MITEWKKFFHKAQLDYVTTAPSPPQVQNGTCILFQGNLIHAARISKGTNCKTTKLKQRLGIYMGLVPETSFAGAQHTMLYSSEYAPGVTGLSQFTPLFADKIRYAIHRHKAFVAGKECKHKPIMSSLKKQLSPATPKPTPPPKPQNP